MPLTDKSPVCPSYRCEEGAQLLGVVQSDGAVAFTPDEIRIDAAFVQSARRGRTPEARFRFAGNCQTGRCERWNGGRCTVVDAVLQQIEVATITPSAAAPDCAIRPRCRWHLQRGLEACRVCSLVITELNEPDGDRA